MAPELTLPSTINSTFQLDNNQSTLLYFQEGIQCQACWVQLVDIESQWNKFEHLGIDEYGEIQWRADYGRYTMYVPVEILIEQIEQSIEQKNLSSADYA